MKKFWQNYNLSAVLAVFSLQKDGSESEEANEEFQNSAVNVENGLRMQGTSRRRM
jgi:hypothetical protein